jgi:membrane protein implicated in regulation of membrane protease activity
MNWWAWMIAGALLLGAELSYVNAQFYLVFVGSAAILVGIASLVFPGWPDWAQWALFALLSVASVTTFRRSIYERLRGPLVEPTADAGVEVLVLPVALAPGDSCQVEHRGSFWTATNGGTQPLEAGARVRILRAEGLGFVVGPR